MPQAVPVRTHRAVARPVAGGSGSAAAEALFKIAERFRSSTESYTFTSKWDSPTVAPMNTVRELDDAAHDQPEPFSRQAQEPFSRQPDADSDALESLGRRAFGTAVSLSFQRVPDGLRTQVYRVIRDRDVFYLRLAETAGDNLETDAELHRHLGALGVRVPEVVHVERFDERIGRSVLISAAVPGVPLEQVWSRSGATSVLRAAGADLARMNQVRVHGFGRIAREGPGPLRARLGSYPELVAAGLPMPWPGQLTSVFSVQALDQIEAMLDRERSRAVPIAHLAHGDVRLAHIFTQRASYTGLIDLGEIRGADPYFDLGYFHLNAPDELYPDLLTALVDGYQDVQPLPADHHEAIRQAAVVHGLPELSHWLAPGRRVPVTHPVVATRVSRIVQLLAAAA
jgi:Ser/Thr protein kinase RdoA (MazF antagonist)